MLLELKSLECLKYYMSLSLVPSLESVQRNVQNQDPYRFVIFIEWQ